MHERSPRSEGALAPCTQAMLVGVLPKGASFVGQMLASPMLGGLANSLNLPTAAVAAVWSQAGVERTLLAYDDAMLPRLQDLPRSLLEAVATSILKVLKVSTGDAAFAPEWWEQGIPFIPPSGMSPPILCALLKSLLRWVLSGAVGCQCCYCGA